SAGSGAYSENGRAAESGRVSVADTARLRLFELALVERLARGVSAVQRVPVLDGRLAQLPAEKDEAIAGQRVEVDQAAIEILHQAAGAVDRVDLPRERLGQAVAPLAQLLPFADVGIVGGGAG